MPRQAPTKKRQRLGGEDSFRVAAGGADLVPDVLGGLIRRERFDRGPRGEALRERLESGTGEQFAQ